MKHELNSKEAFILWNLVNNLELSSLSRMERDMLNLERLDKVDNGNRANDWFKETLKDYDMLQQIKAKLSQYIDEKEINP